MVKLLDEIDTVSCLKKGSQYFAIYTNDYVFTDVLHFTSPCNYSSYLKQWGVVEEKSVFPYQHFSTIEELESTKEFPPKEAFFSDLSTKGVSQDDYSNAKKEYDTRRKLPGIIYYTKYIIINIIY